MAVVLVIGLLPSAAFAAEGDSPIVVSTADKTNVKPGEKLTITYTLAHDLDYMTALDIVLRYDATLFQFVSTDIDGSVWFDNPTQNGAYGADSQALVRIRQYNDDNEETIVAGKICSVTFASLDNISGAQTASFFNGTTGVSRSSIEVDEETLYVKDGAFNHGESDPIKVTITPDGAGPIPTATGYTVSMGADQQVAAGQQVRIPVTVASGEKGITGFNAYDMTFTYDPTALTLNTKTGDAANLTVEDNNGTVRVRRYGATQALGEALALDFTAKATASSTVTLTSAKFDLDANSINFDAPDAAISDADTVVNANNFPVTLPDAFTSDETRLVPNGGSFTFKPVDSHYTYTFTVKMGDTVTEGLTFGANDTYTIEKISGNVEVTCTGKTPKTFTVTQGDDTTGAATATYQTDYTFNLTPEDGYVYKMAVTIGNKAYTGFTPTENDDGTTTYTIPGVDVIGDIVIDSNKQVKLPETYKVTFAGTGAGDAAGESTVQEKANYTFTVAKQKNFEYTITATMGGKAVTVTEGANNTYTIANVTGNLVITIEKKSTLTMEVTVSKYVEMDNKTVFLVTVTGTPEEGKAFAYGDNVMYKTTAYGQNVYSWLVIVDKNETFDQATAEAKITQASATAEEVTQSYDVNETGLVDINDAQLTYDIYSGKYTDFEKVSVRKFLRADVTKDKVVNSADAVAIIANSK